MPEQFPTYSPQGPQIDPLLFPKAQQIGTQIGHATPSTAGAIFQGINEGIKSGISTYQGIQEIESNAETIKKQKADNEVNTDPAVIEARREREIALGKEAQYEGEEADLNREILDANKEIARQTKIDELRGAAATAAQKLGDINNSKAINEALGSTDPRVLASILQNPDYAGTMTRDPKLAAQVLGSLEGRVDPAVLSSARNRFDAVELEKRRIEQIQDQEKRKQIYAEKTDQEFTTAQNSLRGLRGFDDVEKKPDYSYRDVKIYGADEVQPDPNTPNKLITDPATGKPVKPSNVASLSGPDKTYYLAYKNQILDTLNHDEGRKYSEELNKYKTGAAARGYVVRDTPTKETEAPPTAVSNQGNGLAGMAPTPTPDATSSGDINQNIVTAAKARNDNAFKQAEQLGQAGSYSALIQQGAQFAKQPVKQPNYIQTPQTVPVPDGQVPITQPTPDIDFSTNDQIELNKKIAETIGVKPEQISLNVETNPQKPVITPKLYKTINNIPALNGQPAIMKGLVAVESRGNPDAISPAGAAGLTQLMPGTAEELGLSDEDRFIPEKSIAGGQEYLAKKYDEVQKALTREFSKQGISGQPDPRMVLASFNGGFTAVKRAIAAGNLNWEDMKEFLIRNKSRAAGKENTEYPDKVIAASIPFIVGGNASDDAYVRALIAFGIVDVEV